MLESSARELSSMREQMSACSADISKLETPVEGINRGRERSSINLHQHIVDKDVQLSCTSSRIQELEKQLHAANGNVLNMTEKVNHFQQLAGKLAVSVLKLNFKCKQLKDHGQLISQVETQNEKIAMLERCLDGVKADRQALAVTHFHQHKKLTATTADLRKKMLDELIRKKIDHLQSENYSLRMEGAAAKLKLEQNQDALMDVQAAKSSVEIRLETVMQDRSHLSDQVDGMRNTITVLEAGNESFLHRLQDYQEKIALLSNKVSMLENQAVSNDGKIFKIESQLRLKMSEAEASKELIDSHEATITELRNRMVSFNKHKAGMNEMHTISNNDSVIASHGAEIKSIPRTAQTECEDKLLKEEVKHLRAGLEHALQELAVAKKDCKKISRVASKARTLLEKTESEKNQLAVYLNDAQQTLRQIYGNSSQSRNDQEEQR